MLDEDLQRIVETPTGRVREAEIAHELPVELIVVGRTDDVVDPDHEIDGPGTCLACVEARVALALPEAQALELSVELLIPLVRCLLEAVERLVDTVVDTVVDDVDFFLDVGQEKSALNVELEEPFAAISGFSDQGLDRSSSRTPATLTLTLTPCRTSVSDARWARPPG